MNGGLNLMDRLAILGPILLLLGLGVTSAHVVRYLGWRGASEKAVEGGTKTPKSAHNPVVYNATDPSRCREEAVLGTIGVYEALTLVGALGFVLGGGVMIGVVAMDRRRREALA